MRAIPTTTFTVTPSPQPATGEALVFQRRHYELITPLWGGGVKPGTADPVTVIRGTEIRGQLRFWWRATRGGIADGSVKRLREAEGKIWGSAAGEGKAGPSKVHLALTIDNRGQPQSFRNLNLRYVTFPLDQATDNDLKNAQLRTGVKFTLQITFPELLRDDVEAALWAWETFGGLGARTRRGFGAVQCTEVIEKNAVQPPQAAVHAVQRMISDGLEKYVVVGNWPSDVPHLARTMNDRIKVVKSTRVDQAWQALIQALQEFRQKRTKKYGSSTWPEPDAIRRRTVGKAKKVVTASSVDKFPRAAFGLPIIFHFKDEKPRTPPDTSLELAGSDRLASPLILRPVVMGNQIAGVAVILETPVPIDLVLRSKDAPPFEASAAVTKPESAQIGPLDGEPDVLKAFLKTLKS